jgi:hypothetical protein
MAAALEPAAAALATDDASATHAGSWAGRSGDHRTERFAHDRRDLVERVLGAVGKAAKCDVQGALKLVPAAHRAASKRGLYAYVGLGLLE